MFSVNKTVNKQINKQRVGEVGGANLIEGLNQYNLAFV